VINCWTTAVRCEDDPRAFRIGRPLESNAISTLVERPVQQVRKGLYILACACAFGLEGTL